MMKASLGGNLFMVIVIGFSPVLMTDYAIPWALRRYSPETTSLYSFFAGMLVCSVAAGTAVYFDHRKAKRRSLKSL